MSIVRGSKAGQGLRLVDKSPQGREALLRAARRVVLALGYDATTDIEAARLLEGHAEVLRSIKDDMKDLAL